MRVLFWFRRDLRLEDNVGLSEACRDAEGDVVPFYASDPAFLAGDDVAPARVRFVLDSLADLAAAIRRAGSRLVLDHGPPADTVLGAARRAAADRVYWNDVYEPALAAADARVARALEAEGIGVRRFHDRLLVPPGAVLKKNGEPYVVYSPFRAACEAMPLPRPLPAARRLARHRVSGRRLARPEALGLEPGPSGWPGGARAAAKRLRRFVAEGLADYQRRRDLPAEDGTSRLSADLKFGTLSPRTVAAAVLEHGGRSASARTYIAELRWRDFFAHVLHHFPHAARGAFRRELDRLPWEGTPAHFAAWRAGRTGYPIVDAGMRQLLGESFMHNRVRMIVASFLVKDLLLDWRKGERHFMRHLIDGDQANNNGGWQWAASTGTDAQPFFRVFNPVLQGRRFDAAGDYVRRWVPELRRLPAAWIHRPWEAPEAVLEEAGVRLGRDYPHPIVDHAEQRERAIALFRAARARPRRRARRR